MWGEEPPKLCPPTPSSTFVIPPCVFLCLPWICFIFYGVDALYSGVLAGNKP